MYCIQNKLGLHFKYFCIFKRIFMEMPAISTAVVTYIYSAELEQHLTTLNFRQSSRMN